MFKFRRYELPKTVGCTFLSLCALQGFAIAQSATTSDPQRLPNVEVVGTTPTPGVSVDKRSFAGAVQTLTEADIAKTQATSLSELLNTLLGSVHVNDLAGNAHHADVSYRGFAASPTLGMPQGIAVYVDGVRQNQALGDVVDWDLIPRSAISSITLMPGSSPLFGLNALGGALVITTKDGRRNSGGAVELGMGSSKRQSVDLELGGVSSGGLHGFAAVHRTKDEGWRADSPTELLQGFGKIGWSNRATDIALSASVAENSLTGNGLQEQGLLANDYKSVYTKPDTTDHRAHSLTLNFSHVLAGDAKISGVAYSRRIRTSTLNGDVNAGALDQSVYQPNAAERAALTAAGFSGFPASGATAANTPFPKWRCIANGLLGDEPAEKCNGLITRSESLQSNSGLSLQLSAPWRLGGAKNQWVAGVAYDRSRMRFEQNTELGYLLPNRSVQGIGAFGDGVTGGDVDGAPFDTRVDLSGHTKTTSFYASNVMSLQERWHATLSGRYNRTTVTNRDAITPGGGAGSLDGDHRFARFNPALGLTFSPSRTFTAYASASEGSRTPSAIELGCADPDNPCRLPNAMASDPPLRQVVARTVEFGARGGERALTWSASAFRTDNRDDILFVASSQTGYGHFKNFGKTRRQGLDLSIATRQDSWNASAHYTYLDATYQSRERVNGSSNSSNDAVAPGLDGGIAVAPGDKIPLTPAHQFKARLEWTGSDVGWGGWSLDAPWTLRGEVVAIGRQAALGNENGAHQPDGRVFLGQGYSAGYAIFNLSGNVRPAPGWRLSWKINNVFDRRYATAAQLGATAFDAKGNFQARPLPAVNGEYPLVHSTFYAPGTPRSFGVGVGYSW